MYYTPGWGSLATSVIAMSAIVVSTYWNRRTLSAADTRSAEDRRDRIIDRKRNAIAEVLAAAGTHIDMMSSLIVKLTGVLETQGRTDLVTSFHSMVEDRFVPNKRDFITAIAKAMFVVDDVSVTSAIDDVLYRLETALMIDDEDSTEYSAQPASEELRTRQEQLRASVSRLRAAALKAYGPDAK